MNSSEEIKKPSGHIGMILHRGGEYDIVTNSIKGGELIDSIEFKNLIVNTASILMAQRLAPGYEENKNTGTFIASGLQYLAVGTIIDPANPGNFNYMAPPAATVEQTKLEKEIFRKEFTSWTFLDSSGNSVGNNPSNIMRLATTFMENEAIGPLVEMGLFGGDATSDPDTGYMFNYKTFAVNVQAA